MTAYDKEELDDLTLIEEAASLYSAGFIDKNQKDRIKSELTAFKMQNNILVRLGFFLLGSLLYLSICGAISLLGLSGEQFFFSICCYIFALVGFVGAELLANLKYYRHGLDDAFVLGSILNLGIAVAITTEGYELIIAIFVAFKSFLLYRRYLNLPALLVFCMASAAILFFGLLELGEIGKMILPFVTLLFSAGFYFFTKKNIQKLTETYHYNGLLFANSFCLILFYLSCNYLVVRELSVAFMDNPIVIGKDIPFAFFFYGFTLIVPLVYLVQALKTKDRILLWISFLAVGFSIYTIRFYYSVLPIEIALTIGGIVLFAIAYFSIKKLKDKESGLTFKPDRLNSSNPFLNMETLIVASAFGVKPEAKPEDSPMDFGGGGFSGGGSEGTF
ncbi:hypothetical protein [Flavobacterium lipolyticum]|uniref:DUF2157 domain-containing protein n=1 Tax=Flavobacterium lipolyticum TaxID=2893754 RepID=A0ABS8M6F0_9FLAO|nr:hypothetical protein [Flavobacterium sp. F-126]MCC9020284.1 hypothetical protein [Flavobacterium sp. F-126]